jgi:hypothetical protein
MRTKKSNRPVPSREAVGKWLAGEVQDAETSAMGRKVEKLHAQYLAKHKDSNLKRLIRRALAIGATREDIVKRAVNAGYLESYTRDVVGEVLGDEVETPMEAVRITAFSESMYGGRSAELLRSAYFLSEAWDAVERSYQPGPRPVTAPKPKSLPRRPGPR